MQCVTPVHPPPPSPLQGKRYSLREFQDAACAAAAKRFGGLHGCLPARLIEVGLPGLPRGGRHAVKHPRRTAASAALEHCPTRPLAAGAHWLPLHG